MGCLSRVRVPSLLLVTYRSCFPPDRARSGKSASRRSRGEYAFEFCARHEREAPGSFRVRLVEGVKEAARGEAREHRFGRGRGVDHDLVAVGETQDVNGGADDVGGEVSSRALEFGSGPESSPHRPGGDAPAAAEVDDVEPRALQADKTRPIECRAEDSAERERANLPAGEEDADRVAVAQDRDPARIEGDDGRRATERVHDRLSGPGRFPDAAPRLVHVAVSGQYPDVEGDLVPILREPVEERAGEFAVLGVDDLDR